MQKSVESDIVRHLFDVVAHPADTMVEDVHEEPVDVYTDEERFARERRLFFGQTPLLAALSCELAEPGAWKLFDETGAPIVLVRGEDNVVRGFLNVCGHRGARVVEAERGKARRLTCPYHAWTYKTDGTLMAMPQQDAFSGVCRDVRGLKPIPTEERHGTVWVLPQPGDAGLDLTAHLGPFAGELAQWPVSDWQYVETRVHDIAANWKLAMDTFTEGYHIPMLHKDSLATIADGSANLRTQYGDHHRQAVPMKTLRELRDVPTDQWSAFQDMRLAFTYLIYPNVSLTVAGDHAELYQVYPGETIGTSRCLHSWFAYQPVATDADRAAESAKFDFFFNLIEYEDFRVAAGVERGLRSGAHQTQIYGRNEPITQTMHRAFQRDLDASGVL